MNLVKILTAALTSAAALDALSKKTGINKGVLASIIGIAVPMLMKKLTSNA